MNKKLVIGILVVLAAVAAWYLVMKPAEPAVPAATASVQPSASVRPSVSVKPTATATPSDGKNYIGHSLEECMRIRFACPQGMEYFADDMGCGCKPMAQ